MLRKSFLFNQKQTHPKATELHLQKQSFYPGLFLSSPVKLLVELFWLSLRCFFQTSSLALGLILGDCFLFRLARYFTSVRLCCPVGHVDTITWENTVQGEKYWSSPRISSVHVCVFDTCPAALPPHFLFLISQTN